MRAAAFAIGIISALFACPLSSSAQPDKYCAQLQSSMEPGQLYQLICKNRHCFLQIYFPGATIPSGTTQRLLFKTAPSPVQNSLVVVQLKYVAFSPRATPSAVRLVRQPLDFARYFKYFFSFSPYREMHDGIEKAMPADLDDVEHAATVSYTGYDDYHRYKTAPDAESRILKAFHVNYFNGARCVRTFDDLRRPQFLFEDRENAGWRRSVAATLIPDLIDQAAASEVLQYQRLEVILSNYQKQPGTSGCFSFPVQGIGASVTVSISDLEENARANRLDPTTWIIGVQ